MRHHNVSFGSLQNGMPIVAHSMRKFLPMSQNWIYPQVTALQRYQPVVMANQAVNKDAFPLPADRLHIVPRRHRPWAEAVSSLLRMGRDTPSYWRRALGPATPRVVHSHFGHRGYFDMAVTRRAAIPHVVTFYGHDLSRLPRDLVWQDRFMELFQRATLFTVEGSHMKNLLAALGCPENKIRIRRHGADLEKFPFVPRLMGDDGIVRVLVAARFVEKKGVPAALRAIAEVARRHSHVRLTVVGDAKADETEGQRIKREVLALLDSAPLRQCSQWLGSVSIDAFMRIALDHHVFVQASLHAQDGDNEGGAPVSLIQLAATGMPIVATRHCDIPEVVVDGITGALAPEADVPALAAALEHLVVAPDSWSRVGARARDHVREHFEMSRCIANLEAIYDEAAQVAADPAGRTAI